MQCLNCWNFKVKQYIFGRIRLYWNTYEGLFFVDSVVLSLKYVEGVLVSPSQNGSSQRIPGFDSDNFQMLLRAISPQATSIYQYFFATFRNHTFLYPCIHHGTARFIPNSFVAAACFQPTSVELHQTWTFEGCSTNWATLPLTKEQHSVSRLAGRTSDMDSATKKALSTKLTVSGKTK